MRVHAELPLEHLIVIGTEDEAVGFGISQPSQAREIGRFADGVVIGSAVVRLIDENKNKRNLLAIVSGYIKNIKKELR